jgi:hypothetical protein
MRNNRKKIWIDRFQTILGLRIAAYFIIYQLAVWAFAVTDLRISPALAHAIGKGSATYLEILLALAVLALGAVFIFDALRLAHRIVGPMYRFRQTVKAITAGEQVDLIRLRQGDMLLEMRDDLNEMIKALADRGAVVLKTVEVDSAISQPEQALQRVG